MSLTVVCVFVKGHVPFTPEYVFRLKSMAARRLPCHHFVCVTDRPELLPGIDTIVVKPYEKIFAWWNKVRLFDPTIGFTGRMLYLDLDVVIVSDLADVIDFPAAFALPPDGAPNFKPRTHDVVKRFNSSVMVWNGGQQTHLFKEWNAFVANRLWGDQDWIGERAPDATAMPAEWFPRISQVQFPWPVDAKVVLCKKPKNEDALKRFPWFDKEWQ